MYCTSTKLKASRLSHALASLSLEPEIVLQRDDNIIFCRERFKEKRKRLDRVMRPTLPSRILRPKQQKPLQLQVRSVQVDTLKQILVRPCQ